MTITIEPATAPAWATERIEHHDDGTATEHKAVVGTLWFTATDEVDEWRVELTEMTGAAVTYPDETFVRLVDPADPNEPIQWEGTPRRALELAVLLIQAAGLAGYHL